MTCGEKITVIRKENNLTQEQFAELLNVTRQSVSKWEMGTAFPNTEKLIQISKRFSCSLDYLLKEEIEKKDEAERNGAGTLQENDQIRKSVLIGVFYTFLSFAPIIGFIVGIYGLYHQKKGTGNQKLKVLTIVGIVISLILTTVMAVGIIFEM